METHITQTTSNIMLREKKGLMDKISRLGATEHEEIYKILCENKINFTENKNGIFFNLKNVDGEIFDKINKFVDYCFENKPELDEYDQKINECKYKNSLNNVFQRPTSSYGMLHSSIKEPITKKERFKELIEAVDKTDIVKDFIEKIHTSIDRVVHRKTGTKFTMARKKFMKKTLYDTDVHDELFMEEY